MLRLTRAHPWCVPFRPPSATVHGRPCDPFASPWGALCRMALESAKLVPDKCISIVRHRSTGTPCENACLQAVRDNKRFRKVACTAWNLLAPGNPRSRKRGQEQDTDKLRTDYASEPWKFAVPFCGFIAKTFFFSMIWGRGWYSADANCCPATLLFPCIWPALCCLASLFEHVHHCFCHCFCLPRVHINMAFVRTGGGVDSVIFKCFYCCSRKMGGGR